jgi:cell division topological specificity factor
MWNKIIDFLTQEININPNYQDSRNDAKSRLQLVLMQDRNKLAPGVMEKMREEIIEVISRYVEIDRELLELQLQSEANSLALIANIPVLRPKTKPEDKKTEEATEKEEILEAGKTKEKSEAVAS